MKPSYNGEYKIETQSVEISVQKWSREKETIETKRKNKQRTFQHVLILKVTTNKTQRK